MNNAVNFFLSEEKIVLIKTFFLGSIFSKYSTYHEDYSVYYYSFVKSLP